MRSLYRQFSHFPIALGVPFKHLSDAFFGGARKMCLYSPFPIYDIIFSRKKSSPFYQLAFVTLSSKRKLNSLEAHVDVKVYIFLMIVFVAIIPPLSKTKLKLKLNSLVLIEVYSSLVTFIFLN